MLNLTKIVEPYKAIFIDVDNTIFNYTHAHKIALSKILSIFDFSIDDYNESKKEVKKRNLKVNHHKKELYFKLMCEKKNLHFSKSVQMYTQYCEEFNKNILIDRSIFNILSTAKSLNKTIVAITNYYFVDQTYKIETSRVLDFIDFIVTSEEFEKEKPAKTLFNRALELAKVSKKEVLMIGDSNVDDTTEIGIDYYPFNCSKLMIAIAGKSGAGKSTISNLIKSQFNECYVIEGDGYHKYERGHDMWQRLTHYNPEANNLLRLAMDIKNVYQSLDSFIKFPIYDHVTGTFFESNHIANDDINICIIDGLHSIYNEVTNNFVKIKVYIDNELSDYQKVKRDVDKRSTTEDKVIQQIRNRDSDYNNYIKNQQEFANVIIQIDNQSCNIIIKDDFDFHSLETELKKYSSDFRIDNSNKNELKIISDDNSLNTIQLFFNVLIGSRYVR